MGVHTRWRETPGPPWRLAAIVSLSVTHVQNGRAKFQTVAGGCTLEQEMLPLGEALRKVTKM